MARSTYIYVVIDPLDSDRVDATFTVKWEMDKWLEINYPGESTYDVWRYSDGLWRDPPVLYRTVRDGEVVGDTG